MDDPSNVNAMVAPGKRGKESFEFFSFSSSFFSSSLFLALSSSLSLPLSLCLSSKTP